MAHIEIKIDDKLKQYPYSGDIGSGGVYLHNNGSYMFKDEVLSFITASNIAKRSYNCDDSAEKLLAEGSFVIVTDKSDIFKTMWSSVHNGVSGTIYNNVILSTIKGDNVLGGPKNDFIDMRAPETSAYGDAGDKDTSGDDVFFARCGHILLSGNGGANNYFINISNECSKQGLNDLVIIQEYQDNNDDKVHLCSTQFKSTNEQFSIIEQLIQSGITLKHISTGVTEDLGIYIENNGLIPTKPNVIIRNFCDSENTQVNIEYLVDKDGHELHLNELSCNKLEIIDDYIGF